MFYTRASSEVGGAHLSIATVTAACTLLFVHRCYDGEICGGTRWKHQGDRVHAGWSLALWNSIFCTQRASYTTEWFCLHTTLNKSHLASNPRLLTVNTVDIFQKLRHQGDILAAHSGFSRQHIGCRHSMQHQA